MAKQESDDILAPGTIVSSRYRIVRTVGAGAMGVVYEAMHVLLRKRVAIKFMRAELGEDDDLASRFLREARASTRAGHPNIVDVTDMGRDERGRLFFAMEYLEGRPLSALVRQEAPLPPPRAVNIMSQILDALQTAHENGVIHRDLKPDNVFILKGGPVRDFVKILDFGISKLAGVPDTNITLTRTGSVFGTPMYMSPEQARGARDLDNRTDIYACGVLLYEILCGRPPYTGSNYNVLIHQVLGGRFDPPRKVRPDLPSPLEAIILKAMATDADHRFASAREFRSHLHSTIGAEIPPVVSPGGVGPRHTPASLQATLPIKPPAPVPAERPSPASTSEPFDFPEDTGQIKLESLEPPDPPAHPPRQKPIYAEPQHPRPVSEVELDATRQRPPARAVPHLPERHVRSQLLRRLPLVAVVMVLLAGGGGALWYLTRSPGREKSRKGPQRHEPDNHGTDAAVLPVPTREIQVLFNVTPGRMRILLRGKQLISRSLLLVRDSEPITVRFEARGYEPQSRRIVPDRSKTIQVFLKRRKRPGKNKP